LWLSGVISVEVFGLAALVAKATASTEGEKCQDNDNRFGSDCDVKPRVLSGFEEVKAEIESHE